ncbi:MAG: hypothetical protein JNJ73_19525 [Hyphomonadaceae bacterium]|nr:hypothetical protein [Hyphomonadaceae bacterium]
MLPPHADEGHWHPRRSDPWRKERTRANFAQNAAAATGSSIEAIGGVHTAIA